MAMKERFMVVPFDRGETYFGSVSVIDYQIPASWARNTFGNAQPPVPSSRRGSPATLVPRPRLDDSTRPPAAARGSALAVVSKPGSGH